jgi:hypothetical protein
MSSSSSRTALLGLGLLVPGAIAACAAGGATAGPSSSSASSSSSGSGGATGGAGGAASGTTSGVGGDYGSTCSACLAGHCTAEEAACDSECVAVQACLDAVCANLSATGASDEGSCQVHCQSLHPTGKATQLAVVDCAQTGSCVPPCADYSFDWDQCVAWSAKHACKAALDACNASSACTTYQACAATCTTLAGCLACAGASDGAAGEKLDEAYWQCTETECLAEGWLPNP